MKTIRTLLIVASLLCTSCWQQWEQQEEIAEYSINPGNWKYSDKKPITNLWNVEVIEIQVTPEHSAVLNNMPVWMYMYGEGFLGGRRVLTDTSHADPNGRSTCFPVSNGDFTVERIQQYRITSKEDGHLLYSFKSALVGFNCPPAARFPHDESHRVYGELLWNLEGQEMDKFETKGAPSSVRDYICTPETAHRLDAAGNAVKVD